MDIVRPPGRRAAGNREFQRAYKACLSCRQKKARCDLGGGGRPPCARCRREQRQCVFSERRSWARTKNTSTDSRESVASPEHLAGDRSTWSDTGSPEVSRTRDLTFVQDAVHQRSPSTYDSHASSGQTLHGPSDSTGLTTSMMRTVVSSGNDALNLLFEAAAHTDTQNTHLEPSRDSGGRHDYSHSPGNIQPPGAAAMAIGTSPAAPPAVEISNPSRDVLNVWESCRFVKMGWFTAKEAITYVDLFFQNLSPLSPILDNFYSDHQNHDMLVAYEPILCCTILMISSRYHVLPGIGGASRSFFIHHRLWQHCQNLIMRVILGQEKSSKCNTRTVGTIEALLLTSEWHPRSLHFPPESDGWDSDLTVNRSPPASDADRSSNKWLEDVIEPARRSDRMSWMLLGSAYSLAHELGIFETEERGASSSTAEVEALSEQNKLRKQRVQQLLYIYINQLSSRIGCMSLMPQSLSRAVTGNPWASTADKSGDEWQTFMESWMDLTKLTRSVNDMFFPSASFAKQQWHSGRYIGLLDHFRPLLNQWRERHLSQSLNTNFHNILFIEYHYVRVYTHSFGMQAVVERALADDSNSNSNNNNNSNSGEDFRPINIDPVDYEFIQEVIDGCCQILKKVIDLAEADTLRFSPVRIFLRVTSSSIFLLKALSLGVRHAKLQESLDVLDKSVQALRSNILDDVHLASRYAMLLETHVCRLRRNLVASSKSAVNMGMNRSHSTTRSSSSGPPQPPLQQPYNRRTRKRRLEQEQVTESTPETTATIATTPALAAVPAPTAASLTNEHDTNIHTIDHDDWVFSLPFDPSMAPFGPGGGQFSGFEGDTLDFIWNLPG